MVNAAEFFREASIRRSHPYLPLSDEELVRRAQEDQDVEATKKHVSTCCTSTATWSGPRSNRTSSSALNVMTCYRWE